MGERTGIQWTDATWNPTRGCSRVSEGCRNCYAERIAARFSDVGKPFDGFATIGPRADGPKWTGRVELIPEKLDEPLRWKKPRRVFVNSMSDLFHEKLSDEAIDQVFAIMACSPAHTFQVLTKRPERMLEWTNNNQPLDRIHSSISSDYEFDDLRGLMFENFEERWPLPNVWLGVSVEDQATADERIPLLLGAPAAIRFVSYEPALGPVDFRYLQPNDPPTEIDALNGTHGVLRPHGGRHDRLDWIIVGGESGPGARPFNIAWAREAVEQCRAAGVSVFVKQLGAAPYERRVDVDGPGLLSLHDAERLRLVDRKGGDWSEWPKDLRVREFPTPGDARLAESQALSGLAKRELSTERASS